MLVTKQAYDELKKAYNEAVATKKTSFTLQGAEFVTDFAKYYLEFLDLPENKRHIR